MANEQHDDPAPSTSTTTTNLGGFLKKARQDVKMSLRDVEEATGKEVSNAYLSQLESGKITKPSPHILYSLSTALGVAYDALMERAGYIVPAATRHEARTCGDICNQQSDRRGRE
jgi:HTH-type transcriptional regulator, competence development regulator